VTNHILRDRIPRWWTHVNLPKQVTIKKCILYIKLREGPLSNKNHDKSVNSGHMSNESKSLIIMTMLLLKITDNKTTLIALNKTIRASINHITHLPVIGQTCERHDTRSHVLVRSRATISSTIACCHSG
jgi:hypothetical protein